MRNLRCVALAIVCLGITAPAAAWADPAQIDRRGRIAGGGDPDGSAGGAGGLPRGIDPSEVDWVEDPFAPHVTQGTTARLGTAVGFLYGEPLDAMAIGATVALGQRFGRLAISAELAVLALQARGPAALRIGDAERLGALARVDVIRIGPDWVGPNSLLCVYAEAGAATAWNHWRPVGPGETVRAVPDDTTRVEGQVGFGLALDHRLQKPVGFPHRVGWFLGWRLALAPRDTDAIACRSETESCRTLALMAPPDDGIVARSMLFQSSLEVTW